MLFSCAKNQTQSNQTLACATIVQGLRTELSQMTHEQPAHHNIRLSSQPGLMTSNFIINLYNYKTAQTDSTFPA